MICLTCLLFLLVQTNKSNVLLITFFTKNKYWGKKVLRGTVWKICYLQIQKYPQIYIKLSYGANLLEHQSQGSCISFTISNELKSSFFFHAKLKPPWAEIAIHIRYSYLITIQK